MSKAKAKWNQHLDEIPGLRDAIDGVTGRKVLEACRVSTDATAEYDNTLASLPPSLRESLQRDLEDHEVTEEPTPPGASNLQWCLAVMPEGEFPRVTVFPSAERLASAVASREGEEVAVWPFFGIPLRLSRSVADSSGRQVRYMLLPNQAAITVGSHLNGLELIGQSELPPDLAMQDEGWLGDQELLQEQGYFLSGYVEVDEFSADPDMDGDETKDE